MSRPLYKYLLSLKKDRVHLKELNGIYTPIMLASQIETLLEQELILVDWNNKIILFGELSIENVFKVKNKIGSYNREVPEYMKVEKIKINQPYIKTKKK